MAVTIFIVKWCARYVSKASVSLVIIVVVLSIYVVVMPLMKHVLNVISMQLVWTVQINSFLLQEHTTLDVCPAYANEHARKASLFVHALKRDICSRYEHMLRKQRKCNIKIGMTHNFFASVVGLYAQRCGMMKTLK